MDFSQQDLELFAKKGITQQQVEAQLKRFATGFPFLVIKEAARPAHGITILSHDGEHAAIDRWQKYLDNGGQVCKFVPASGAASRMFKKLFEFVDGPDDVPAPGSDVEILIDNIDKMAFINDLNEATQRIYAMSVPQLKEAHRFKDIIAAIIKPQGLNYGNLPKGLLKFHAYPDGSRTPVEEQMVEGTQTAANANGEVNLHFTVSANHRKLFEEKIASVINDINARRNVRISVSLSEQKPSTDTIAANPDGTPFTENGSLLFRPGGHGALIENLNDINSAVVFIKNIDNVVPDSLRQPTIHYKKVIAGYMMQLHDTMARYMEMLTAGKYSRADLDEMLQFLRDKFSITTPDIAKINTTDIAMFVHEKLNRPLRVCGMVRNEGEPGGGPYIAVNPDGTASLQILESTQIDPANDEYKRIVSTATHFNPVDLVCYIEDFKGHKYDLTKYVDPDTGFISSKSSHGKELRAMELPGLWNGAMSDWNTAFVEVPIDTFNPVKTVNDLLRPAHQS